MQQIKMRQLPQEMTGDCVQEQNTESDSVGEKNGKQKNM